MARVNLIMAVGKQVRDEIAKEQGDIYTWVCGMC